jgi:hypothetical protein
MTAIQLINEVRQLVGLNTITSLTADKQARVALRLLNEVISYVASKGDWHEVLACANVTATVSVREYELGLKHPVHHIHEIAISGRAQALYPIDLSEYTRYRRAGGTGTPNFFATKGVDSQGNPKFAVHPQPASANDGDLFLVLYYKKPRLLLTCDADVEVEFAADMLLNGLYAKVLEEEAGGVATRESMNSWQTFNDQIQEELNRFNSDAGKGEDVQLVPGGIR